MENIEIFFSFFSAAGDNFDAREEYHITNPTRLPSTMRWEIRSPIWGQRSYFYVGDSQGLRDSIHATVADILLETREQSM